MDTYYKTLDELNEDFDITFKIEDSSVEGLGSDVRTEQTNRIQEFDISGRILEALGVDKEVIDYEPDDDVTVRVFNIPGTNVSEIGIRA